MSGQGKQQQQLNK